MPHGDGSGNGGVSQELRALTAGIRSLSQELRDYSRQAQEDRRQAQEDRRQAQEDRRQAQEDRRRIADLQKRHTHEVGKVLAKATAVGMLIRRDIQAMHRDIRILHQDNARMLEGLQDQTRSIDKLVRAFIARGNGHAGNGRRTR